ncbi:hypothetical protein ACFPIF_19525 [Brevundimonas faecalis]|uniref:hypothetical protein n=1 Tax=Brevundimonas faecalis TaxID=947378 RepID=UPI003608C9F9
MAKPLRLPSDADLIAELHAYCRAPAPAPAAPVVVHLSAEAVDRWRDEILFGAYTPDPDTHPPHVPTPLGGGDLPPIHWMPARRPTRLMRLVRAVIVVFVAAFALAQMLDMVL